MPLSNVPWVRPTPRKLKRRTARPRATKLLYSDCVFRSFIVPPPCGCGWRISATGARGRGGGEKRPSMRPSGPGKITSGMGAPLIFYGWPPNRRAGRVAERRWRLYRNCVACCDFCESLALRIDDCTFSPGRIEPLDRLAGRSEEHRYELQSLTRNSAAV